MKHGLPNQLGRYHLVREIGRGAMGVIYLATDPVIGRSLALKTIHLPKGLDEAGRTECFDRFAREARAAGVLSHPGIVTIYDAGLDEKSGLSYIAMEYVAGHTLKEEIHRTGALDVVRVQEIAVQIAQALAYAHERHIVHRDLKPSNILMGEDGLVKIADFGIAKVETSDLTRDGQSIGSPAYMSPEQVLGRAVDGRADLFSFGLVLYEMLTGRRPFSGEDANAIAYQIVHEKPAELQQMRPAIPASWDMIVARLTAKRPEQRYPDARSLLLDLAHLKLADEHKVASVPAADTDRTVVDSDNLGDKGVVRGSKTRSTEHVGGGFLRAESQDSALPDMRSICCGFKAILHPFVVNIGRYLSHVVELVRAKHSQIHKQASGVGRAATHSVEGDRKWRLPQPLDAFNRFDFRRRTVVLALVAPLVMGLVGATVSWFFGPHCPIRVELKHSLEAGKLLIEVDGETVIKRRFQGGERATRIFGKEFFKRTSGELEDFFAVHPGEREVTVTVEAVGETGAWSQTVQRSFSEGEGALLKITLARGLSKDLRLNWSSMSTSSFN